MKYQNDETTYTMQLLRLKIRATAARNYSL